MAPKKKPIGADVKTTDDMIEAGLDATPVQQGGTAKVSKKSVEDDKVLEGVARPAYDPLRLVQDFQASFKMEDGLNFDLSAAATGGKAPYTRQWFHNGALSTLTAETIGFTKFNKPSQGYWYCIVTDANGDTVKSNSIYIY